MTRIPFDEMQSVIRTALVKAGMTNEKADICARIHTASGCDGVYSHGLNRVARFIDYVTKGWVNVQGEPVLSRSVGPVMEIWDGNLGPGILNAQTCMDRATEMASVNGIGLVSLMNTTHWMRGGTYGWQAAEKGFAAICWTNTESCMPPWGAKSIAIGNNPFIMAIPREEGHIVLDMAMSQFSYGKLQVTRLKNEKLPFPGGYDSDGKLTDVPGPIEQTMRILPTGYWKGSGLAILLDLFSALLSGGLTTAAIDRAGKGSCGRCNQVFIAVNPEMINSREVIDAILKETVAQVKGSAPAEEGGEIFYPGEKSLHTRKINLELGIPVDDGVWQRVLALAGL